VGKFTEELNELTALVVRNAPINAPITGGGNRHAVFRTVKRRLFHLATRGDSRERCAVRAPVMDCDVRRPLPTAIARRHSTPEIVHRLVGAMDKLLVLEHEDISLVLRNLAL